MISRLRPIITDAPVVSVALIQITFAPTLRRPKNVSICHRLLQARQ
jgi:hypothetical protein